MVIDMKKDTFAWIKYDKKYSLTYEFKMLMKRGKLKMNN